MFIWIYMWQSCVIGGSFSTMKIWRSHFFHPKITFIQKQKFLSKMLFGKWWVNVQQNIFQKLPNGKFNSSKWLSHFNFSFVSGSGVCLRRCCRGCCRGRCCCCGCCYTRLNRIIFIHRCDRCSTATQTNEKGWNTFEKPKKRIYTAKWRR